MTEIEQSLAEISNDTVAHNRLKEMAVRHALTLEDAYMQFGDPRDWGREEPTRQFTTHQFANELLKDPNQTLAQFGIYSIGIYEWLEKKLKAAEAADPSHA